MSTPLLGALLATGLHAVLPEPEFLWLGGSSTPHWSQPGNWYQSVPPDAANAQVFLENDLGINTVTYVHLDGSRMVGRLFLRGNVALTGDAGSVLSVHQGIEVEGDDYYYAESSLNGQNPISAVASISDQVTLALAGANTWRTQYRTVLNVFAPLTGSEPLTIDGEGQVNIRGSSPTYTGTITLQSGRLGLAGGDALGTGTLVFGPGTDSNTMLVPDGEGNDGVITVENPLVIHDTLRVGRDQFSGGVDLEFSNVVTLMGDVILRLDDTPVFFSGSIVEEGGPARVTIDSPTAAAIFAGNSGFTGGLHAESGAAIFLHGSALPADGFYDFSSSTTGYIGLADPTTPMAAFISRFNPATTTGAIGFDTNPSEYSTPHIFPGNIFLSAFHPDVRLGSISSAILTGVITPVSAEADYRFGTGGGTLFVQSPLTGDRGVTVESPFESQLMVVLGNAANDFTGDITVQHSGIRFAHPGALPAGANFQLNSPDAYIGTSDFSTLANFLSRFPTTAFNGIVGLDDGLTTTTPLDLSTLTGSGEGIFVGTSTTATIGAGFIPAGGQSPAIRLTGYRGGQLRVDAPLTGPYALYLGHPSFLGHEGANGYSSVRLNTANTFTGDTYLLAGALVLGHPQALGEGSLRIGSTPAYPYPGYLTPVLQAPGDVGPLLNFANNIILNDQNLEVRLETSLHLHGSIDGWGQIELNGGGHTLGLFGHNPYFDGGVVLRSGNLLLGSDTALGNASWAGPLVFEFGSGSVVQISAPAPVIGGLEGGTAPPFSPINAIQLTPLPEAAPVSLTLSVPYSHRFYRGAITGDGSLRVVGSGYGNATFSSFSYYYGSQALAGHLDLTGGITVEDGGRLIFTPTTTLANQARLVTIGNSGSLVIGGHQNLVADISFSGYDGQLAGQGRITPINGPGTATLVVQNYNTLAPGMSVGSLELGHAVVFGPQGRLEFELDDGPGGGLIHDSLLLYSLTVTATPVNPFQIWVGAANFSLYNFNPHAEQAWTLLTTTQPLPALDLLAFSVELNYSMYNVNLFDGSFSLAQVGNSLNLTFTPIPEPSTAVLLLLGLGLLAAHRPRRRT